MQINPLFLASAFVLILLHRSNSVAFIEDVMQAIEIVDKAKALAVSKENR